MAIGVAILVGSSAAALLAVPDHRGSRSLGRSTAAIPRLDVASLEPGDLIFRRGESLHSRAVLLADDRSPFSHVGIAVLRGDEIEIAHATPPPDGQDEDGTRLENVATFLRESGKGPTLEWTVLRPLKEHRPAGKRAAEEALAMVRRGAPFDDTFDHRDDRALYCTELVWLAYRRAGLDLVAGRALPEIDLPLSPRREVILPSTLLESASLRQVPSVGPAVRPSNAIHTRGSS